VRGTKTVHLQETNSDFLIPMILYFPVKETVLHFYLKPLSIIKVCNSENIFRSELPFFYSGTSSKLTYQVTNHIYMKEQNKTHTHKVWSDVNVQ